MPPVFHRQVNLPPQIARSKSFNRGLIFAFRSGWERGFIPSSSLNAGYENVRRGTGLWASSVDSANHAVIDAGRVIRTGGGSKDRLTFADTSARYDIRNGFTVAILARPVSTLAANNAQGLFTKNDNTTPTFANETFDIHWDKFGGRDTWRFQLNNSATQVADTLTAPSISRTDMLVGTASPAASLIRIWQNGVLQASTSVAHSISTTSRPLIFFEPLVSGSRLDAYVGMCAMWNRVLPNREVMALSADPFIIWREAHREFAMGPGKVISAAQPQTYFLAF